VGGGNGRGMSFIPPSDLDRNSGDSIWQWSCFSG